MNGRCHCGGVTIEVPGKPAYLNLCNCSVCFKLGTMWGYYAAADVRVDGDTQYYMRGDVAEPRLRYGFCGICGATTHWSSLDPDRADRIGVNMRLFEPSELAGIEVRYGDRRTHDRISPPPSYRAPTIFTAAGATA